MNSNNVLRLSGEGAVTNILLNPNLIAAAIPNPMAADLPRPLPAVSETVVFEDLSLSTSSRVMMTLAWSKVLALASNSPTTYLGASDFFKPSNYSATFLLITLLTSSG
jgi:hypothetical protein